MEPPFPEPPVVQVDAKPISIVSVNDIESERVATEVERELYWLVISDSEVCGLSDLASFQVDAISVMMSFDVNGNGIVTTEATDVLDSIVKEPPELEVSQTDINFSSLALEAGPKAEAVV